MNGGIRQLSGLERWTRGSTVVDTPDDIAGLALWLKTETLIGYVNNDPIPSWSDSSGSTHDFSQSTPVSRPLYKTNSINSRPAVQGQSLVYMTATQFSLGSSCTVFFVMKRETFGADGIVIGDVAGMYCPYIDGTDIYLRNGSGNGFVSVAHGVANLTVPTLYVIRRSGTSVDFFINGSQAGTTQTLTANSAQMVSSIFGYNDGSFGNPQHVPEIVIYDSALSTPNRQAIETYFNSRYATY